MARIGWPILALAGTMDVIGVVWILQGFNVLPGSFMTGDPRWAAAGIVLLVVSVLTLHAVRGARRG